MAAYLRLKSNFDISKATPQAKIVLQAMKTYGCVIQENGTVGYLNGDVNAGWNPDDLHWIKDNVKLSNLEFIDVSSLEIAPNTAQAVQPNGPGSLSGTNPSSTTTAAVVHHAHSGPRAQ
jgi:hypothetical protein